MTDKDIIIDGVNVAGCRLYEHKLEYRMYDNCDCKRIMVPQSSLDELSGVECKGYDCYYKQLQRKIAECNELSQGLEELNNCIQEKTQECEELKEQVKLTRKYLADSINEYNKAESYKQALKKIEEIAKPFASRNPIYNCWSLLLKCSCCSEKKECTKENPFKQMKNILNLINEVKDDRTSP